MEQQERRKNTRVQFQSTASLTFPDLTFEKCETRNLSVRDVFVMGVAGRKRDEECSVKLCLTGVSSELCLWMKGKVTRMEEEGIAIRFHELDLESYLHLKNIVYFNSADPDTVLGDLSEEFPIAGEFDDSF